MKMYDVNDDDMDFHQAKTIEKLSCVDTKTLLYSLSFERKFRSVNVRLRSIQPHPNACQNVRKTPGVFCRIKHDKMSPFLLHNGFRLPENKQGF